MSSLDGDKHSLNISDKLKDELTCNPVTRSITTHQMESIKRMTKTMSMHRQKKVRFIGGSSYGIFFAYYLNLSLPISKYSFN